MSRSSFSDAASSCARAGQQAARLRLGLQPGGQEPELESERDEPLLRAVVQIALEAAALGVAGLDHARDHGRRRAHDASAIGGSPA